MGETNKMDSEIRSCQNCKQEFRIEPEDFGFYEKMQVPPPTWCPKCRMRRRMCFRNERTLYKAVCQRCGKSMISMYSPDAPFIIYCSDCWHSDNWDPLVYGREYDFTRPFFEQYKNFLVSVPRPNLEASQNTDCPYTNYTWESKKCYLAPSTIYSENVAYSYRLRKCSDCYDSYYLTDCQSCQECVNCTRCSSGVYLDTCRDCLDSYFLYDCVNCTNCFMSSNLRNRSYVIENQQYNRDGYWKKVAEYNLRTYFGQESAKDKFKETIKNAIHRYAQIYHSTDSSGDNISDAKNCRNVFDMYNIENVRYMQGGFNVKDSLDIYGVDDEEWCYESINDGLFSSRSRFCANTHTNCLDVQFCDYCRSGSHLFACVSLKNGSYCVFNKQYSSSEYEKLVSKIIVQMAEIPYIDSIGRIFRYGEYFPPEISPFGYNETAAQQYFPITKTQAIAEGFRWSDPRSRNYQVTLRPESLPEIEMVTENLLQETIGCVHDGQCEHDCSLAFRLIPEEIQFYQKMKIPLPRLCPNCRFAERNVRRNPVELWHRQCMCGRHVANSQSQIVGQNGGGHFHGGSPCSNEFETPFAPDRPETIYCESCYQQEVA